MTILERPALIVFSGLPGTGKTALSRELAIRLTATHVRIDAIEQALRDNGLAVGAAGYAIANAIAAENLKLRRHVIADCVNPVHVSRTAWRQTALQNSAPIVEIEVVCSDPVLHRQRVESRSADISGHKLPSWDDVVKRHYEPWDREHLVLDTARDALDHLVAQAEAYAREKIG
jgi:predicted kinase